MIAGFEAPTSGTVHLDGQHVTRQAPFARNVNTVFQDYALFPHLDVLGNVEYGLAVKKVPRKERRERAEAALASVQLGGYGARKPGQLSGGQRQRVALARALVNRPKVLLLDEPLGALDLKLRREMQIELKDLQREVGITFVFVTHDQEEALTMSDRIAVFNEGRIEQLATPVELYEHPASAFVAGFVGTSNLLEGDVARTVVGEDGQFVIRPEKVAMLAPGASAAPTSPDTCLARGVVRDVVYLGSATHSIVQLDAGATLTVAHQNTDRSIDAALERRDQPVVLSWRRDSLVPLGGPAPAAAGSTTGHDPRSPEEETG
jgi:putative spermidine/putrescine transport system ATP-binding protein